MKIEARFKKYPDAFNILTKLKAKGLEDAHIPADSFSLNQNGNIDVPGSHNATSLSNLVLNSGDDTDQTPSPLGAADPMVSGMGGFEEITEDTYSVVVNADEGNFDQIRHLIVNAGGRIENWG